MSTNRNINDIIVDKIHATFVELVPEDELREIVAKAIDDFKAPKVTKNGWNNREVEPSPLEAYVQKAITGLLEKAVQKHIDAALDVTYDEHGARIASEIITKAVEKAAPVMVASFVQGAGEIVATRMVMNLTNQLREKGLQVW